MSPAEQEGRVKELSLLSRSNTQRYHIAWVSGEEERQKVVSFSSVFLLPARKWEAVTQGGIDHPTRRKPQGCGILKG